MSADRGNSGDAGARWAGDFAPVRLPDACQVFATRAARFRALAPGHVVGDFLEFLGRLADAQAHAARSATVTIEPGRLAGPAPFSPAGWMRGEGWRLTLAAIVSEMRRGPMPPGSAAAFDRLSSAPPAELERCADVLLAPDQSEADAAMAPIVGAALQVHWTSLASLIPADALDSADGAGGCPVCGSAPVAGLVLGDRRLRYLVCPLCATEWHLTRVTCSACRDPSALSYLTIDGALPGVKAEACGVCRTYLKLFYLDQRPSAEAVADDVACLALDLLVAKEGYARAGANPFLVVGAGG